MSKINNFDFINKFTFESGYKYSDTMYIVDNEKFVKGFIGNRPIWDNSTSGIYNDKTLTLLNGADIPIGTNLTTILQNIISGGSSPDAVIDVLVNNISVVNEQRKAIITIPTDFPPSGPASGDLTGNYPGPSIKESVFLTGNPTTTTQPLGTSNNTISTTKYVDDSLIPKLEAVSVASFEYQNPTLISQEVGYSTTNVMSQNAVTLLLDNVNMLLENRLNGLNVGINTLLENTLNGTL